MSVFYLAQTHNSSVQTMAQLVDWLQNAPATLLLDSFLIEPSEKLIDSDRELLWAPTVESNVDY